ncbi:MAG: hypothetical protein ATN35_00465 [Epulopiscium sp. Nele67-Bin004]|nr:MAG: hypothetical protein ATN35_00465 [Epulopiscium sp. Nele67-Bin004]
MDNTAEKLRQIYVEYNQQCLMKGEVLKEIILAGLIRNSMHDDNNVDILLHSVKCGVVTSVIHKVSSPDDNIQINMIVNALVNNQMWSEEEARRVVGYFVYAKFGECEQHEISKVIDIIEEEHIDESIKDVVSIVGEFEFNATTGIIIKYMGDGASCIIPEEINGVHIKAIGESAFKNCYTLTTIEISNSDTVINLNMLPDNIKTIISNRLEFDFKQGTIIKYVGDDTACIIPDKIYGFDVITIGESAFWECNGLTSVEIPNSVISIGDRAFGRCRELTSIEIPNGVKEIGNFTFMGCNGLTNVKIPNSVTTIGNSAFSGCSELVIIKIPSGVTFIGDCAFEGCSRLVSVEIPEGITNILYNTFGDCAKLTSIEIPSSVTFIADWAFVGCDKLTKVKILNGDTVVEINSFPIQAKVTKAKTADKPKGNIFSKFFK